MSLLHLPIHTSGIKETKLTTHLPIFSSILKGGREGGGNEFFNDEYHFPSVSTREVICITAVMLLEQVPETFSSRGDTFPSSILTRARSDPCHAALWWSRQHIK